MQENIAREIVKTKYFPKLPYPNQERTQKFLGIVLTLLALSFFGFFAINPTVSTILKLRKELSDSQFVYDQLGSKIENLNELRIQYANLQSDIPIITDSISMEPDIHLLFAQIQTAARQSGIILERLQNFEIEVLSNQKESEKEYYSFSFSILGRGSFENIYNFSSTITQMQRIVSIDTLAMNNISNQNVQSLGFNIQGTAFFKR